MLAVGAGRHKVIICAVHTELWNSALGDTYQWGWNQLVGTTLPLFSFMEFIGVSFSQISLT